MRLIVNAREPWVPPGKNTYRKAGSLSEAPRETSDLALASIPERDPAAIRCANSCLSLLSESVCNFSNVVDRASLLLGRDRE